MKNCQLYSKSKFEAVNTQDQFRRILEEHKKDCEKNGNFVEASLTKKKLRSLQKYEYTRQKQILLANQEASIQALKATYQEELNKIRQKWDSTILCDYRGKVEDKMFELKQKQTYETLNEKSKRSKSVNQRGRRIDENPIKIMELPKRKTFLGKYQESANISRRFGEARLEDSQNRNSQIPGNLTQKCKTIKKKHFKEQSALEIKIQTYWQKLCKQREKEMEVIHKRYKNVTKEVIQKYKLDFVKLARHSPMIKNELNDKKIRKSHPNYTQFN